VEKGRAVSVLEIRRPAVQGGLILYLDYDGVLHPEDVRLDRRRRAYIASPEGHRLFEHAELLNGLLAPYPEISLVLSTSWVRVYGSVSRVAKRLPPALGTRVIGATYHREMDEHRFAQMPRGMQIWADVLRRHPIDWLAVDDMHHDWPVWCRANLVCSDAILGISAPPVLAELRAKLAAMHARRTPRSLSSASAAGTVGNLEEG
jgi:HAD domain in Swiss Army Knife RNA repair proteins